MVSLYSISFMKKIFVCLLIPFIFITNAMAQVAITHTVKKGESLYGIAQQYGVSVELLKQANPDMGDYFYAGLVLNIPAKIDSQSTEKEYVAESPSMLPLTNEGSEHLFSNSSPTKVKDITNYGLMYWGFDGYKNYGVFAESITYNNVGVEMAGRTKFEKHSNFNWELGLNYSLGLFRQENSALLVTASFSPLSVRFQDEYDYKRDKYKNKVYFDAYYSIRLSLKLGCFALTGGYFYWAPKWDFGKDQKMDGFCIGLMYSTKK